MISRATLDRLRTLDTPTVCNLIELFERRPRTAGYMNERIRARFPELPPMVGFASPVTVRAATGAATGGYAELQEHVRHFDDLPADVVVVQQDLDNPMVAATFGEVMCSTYRAFGALGLVSGGAGRDLDQVRALDFPVFTAGVICSHGYFHTVDIHVPVHVGGIVVRPGDLLHGDCNGVTTVPLEIATELADIADEFIAAENIVIELVRTGRPSLDELAAARAESKSRIDEIAGQLSKR